LIAALASINVKRCLRRFVPDGSLAFRRKSVEQPRRTLTDSKHAFFIPAEHYEELGDVIRSCKLRITSGQVCLWHSLFYDLAAKLIPEMLAKTRKVFYFTLQYLNLLLKKLFRGMSWRSFEVKETNY